MLGHQQDPIIDTPTVAGEQASNLILIVGLHKANNGRLCAVHEDPEKPCGSFVEVGNLVRFKRSLITNNDGKFEPAMKAVLFDAGNESCTIGFLPRAFLHRAEALQHKFAQIVDLKQQSENANMRRFSYRNGGAASALLLDDVPGFE
ncbi:hypothetical protein BC829DRAFT_422700 [Chytridium lagenaria]|nr:hypothetical protein BC829DRAFT_422700 [Chytridium lagenaria]